MVSYWERRRRKEMIEVQNTHKDIETIEKIPNPELVEKLKKRRKKRDGNTQES